MVDRFTSYLAKIWALRDTLKRMTPEQRAAYAAALSPQEREGWVFRARDAQLPPRELLTYWLCMAGRGFGKTHALSGAVHLAVQAGISRIGIIAPTAADVRDVIVEGVSGIRAQAPPGMLPHWEPSKRRLTWPNGAIATTFSGEEPESLRGPQFELVLVDEIGRMQAQQQIFDMMNFGLRLGDFPRAFFFTTPRKTPLIKKLVADEGKNTTITRGRTDENRDNLAATFIQQVYEVYAGTRLGLQELNGELLEDDDNLVFKSEWLLRDNVEHSMLQEIAVGVDPSGGGDEIGIVAAGRIDDHAHAVLADRTVKGSPAIWGREAVKLYDELEADSICVEVNYGGDMCEAVIKQAAKDMYNKGERTTEFVKVIKVTSSRGKVLRAEPVALLYEQGKVKHAAALDKLEAEMLKFTKDWKRDRDGSPNRLDAMVFALTKTSVRERKRVHVAVF